MLRIKEDRRVASPPVIRSVQMLLGFLSSLLIPLRSHSVRIQHIADVDLIIHEVHRQGDVIID